jgi:multidrug efflux pump subunit AcrA (membrane-fusion protein)
MNDSPSLWPSLLTGFGALGGLSALLGLWLNRRRAPAEVRLITVQAAVAEATREKTSREAESLAVGSLEKALTVAERTIDRMRSERDKAEAQVRILELELEQARAARKLAERPGNGKGN